MPFNFKENESTSVLEEIHLSLIPFASASRQTTQKVLCNPWNFKEDELKHLTVQQVIQKVQIRKTFISLRSDFDAENLQIESSHLRCAATS